MQAAVCHVSPYGGTWYPDDPYELQDLLDRLFETSERRTGCFLAAHPSAFVIPHAGLIYSGAVAASAYRHVRAEQPERVLLLGFSHRGSAPGAWIPDVSAFKTPLGEIAVDRAAVKELLDSGSFRPLSEAILCDHSVEIQLPFLQVAAPGAQIVPLYISDLDAGARMAAANELSKWVRPRTVLLASSDFTHYGRAFSYQPFPADQWVSERLRDLDQTVINAAGSLSGDLFFETLETTKSTVCGHQPIGLLLAALERAGAEEEIFQELLDYQTSGDVTGDFQHCVSYAALGYFQHRAFHLDAEDGKLLLESARRTLERYQETGERTPVPPACRTPALERRAAVFVTLHKDGELRGCVGRRAAAEPLAEAVPELTLAAALEDTRFQPVSRFERDIEIEISVLSPMKRIPNLDSFRVNLHGAYLEAKGYSGLLLPQVATERDWTAAQFLDALARKTGVTSSVYRDPLTRIYVFRAQIIQ